MDDIYDIRYTLDGTWAKRWREQQNATLPRHVIDHLSDDLKCACGYQAEGMEDVCKHIAEMVVRDRNEGGQTVR